jgi:hypothetical protein
VDVASSVPSGLSGAFCITMQGSAVGWTWFWELSDVVWCLSDVRFAVLQTVRVQVVTPAEDQKHTCLCPHVFTVVLLLCMHVLWLCNVSGPAPCVQPLAIYRRTSVS